MTMSYEAPFSGLKVVDLSQGIAAPYAGMLLAQYGAEVLKVEVMDGGDWYGERPRARRQHVALSDGQPRQAQHRARPQIARGLRGAVAPRRRRRRVHGGLPPGRDRPARLLLRGGVGEKSAHPVSRDVGLRPVRPARRAAGDGPGAASLLRVHDGEPRGGRHAEERHLDPGRSHQRALRLPGGIGGAVRATRRDARALHRGEPDARCRVAQHICDAAEFYPRRRAAAAAAAEQRVPHGGWLAPRRGGRPSRLGGVLYRDRASRDGDRQPLRHHRRPPTECRSRGVDHPRNPRRPDPRRIGSRALPSSASCTPW